MLAQCPYCGHAMKLAGVRPGRFGPRCVQCTRKFLLVISDDPNQPPMTLAVEGKSKETVSTDVAVALGIVPPPKEKKGPDGKST
jgi:hypothetical protein